MNAGQFAEWVNVYRKRFLGPGENFDFVLEWRRDIEGLDFNDAAAAIRDVALDSRDEARFPRQHLRLLLEYADLRRAEREAASRPKKRWGPPPASTEAWDREMLRVGAIEPDEFARRQAARNGATA